MGNVWDRFLDQVMMGRIVYSREYADGEPKDLLILSKASPWELLRHYHEWLEAQGFRM